MGYQDLHLTVNFQRQKVSLDGTVLALTRKEYELLALLCEHAGDIVPRDVLLSRIWGYGAGVRTRTLDVHIRRLRRKLEPLSGKYIETIFGVGYRFQPFQARSNSFGLLSREPMTAIA
jgi:DNA-binding response OmpR family regulator